VTITRRIALITLGALVIVVGAWYGALWRPAEKHLSTLRSEQTAAANNVMTLQAQADALRGEQKQLPKDRVELSQLQAAIPNGPSLDQLIKVIDNAARDAGVSLTSLGTPPPSGWGSSGATSSAALGPGPQDFQVSVGLQGSDRGMLQFVTDLGSQSRLFVVDSFSLNSAPGSAAATGAAAPATPGTYTVSVTAFYISAAANNPVFPGPA
jgi:Tfp pilus assembly protein PilO